MAHAAFKEKLRAALHRRAVRQFHKQRRRGAHKGIVFENMAHLGHVERADRFDFALGLEIYVKEAASVGNDERHARRVSNAAVHDFFARHHAAHADAFDNAHAVRAAHRHNVQAGLVCAVVIRAFLARSHDAHAHAARLVCAQLVHCHFIGGIGEMLTEQTCLSQRFAAVVFHAVTRKRQGFVQHRAVVLVGFEYGIRVAAAVIHPVFLTAHFAQLHAQGFIRIDRKTTSEFHFINRMHGSMPPFHF